MTKRKTMINLQSDHYEWLRLEAFKSNLSVSKIINQAIGRLRNEQCQQSVKQRREPEALAVGEPDRRD